MVATLFVGRLPWNFKEDDLIALFGSFSGFQSARLRTNKWNNLVAFVDFNNFENAERAKENLQGYKLDKDQKGLFIQYSHSSPTTIPLKSLGNGYNSEAFCSRKQYTYLNIIIYPIFS